MPLYIATPGESRPLLVRDRDERTSPIKKRRWWIVLGAILTFSFTYFILSLLPSKNDPLGYEDIYDGSSCTEERIFVPLNNSIIKIASSLKKISIQVKGGAFGAFQFRVGETSVVELKSHFHAVQDHDKFLSISYSLEDGARLNVEIDTPEVKQEACIVATSIITLPPENLLKGLDIALSATSLGVNGLFGGNQLGSLDVRSKKLFFGLQDVVVSNVTTITSESGVSNFYNSSFHSLEANYGRATLKTDGCKIDKCSFSSSVGDFQSNNLVITELLNVKTRSGKISLTLEGLRVATRNSHIDILDFNAERLLDESKMEFKSSSGNIKLEMIDYSGDVNLETTNGRIETKSEGRKISWYSDLPRNKSGTVGKVGNLHKLRAVTNTGDLFLNLEKGY
ncbi:hypothetical protein HDU97_004057 [Phlyctochytrium planicorne]|nr:hypothetical protein HDU97_004057 [Phlyctochytrium planicorne]